MAKSPIGVKRTLNRNVERVFDSSRKERHRERRRSQHCSSRAPINQNKRDQRVE